MTQAHVTRTQTTEGSAAGTGGPRFAIIGAGMSGILSVIRLTEKGYRNIQIFEKAEELGGTWRENRYPGIACDVPSHLYSYSFAPNPGWSHTYSPGAEIQEYFRDVSARYGVTEQIRFGEEVTKAEFRDGVWHLETSKGAREEADFIIAATGVLHHPNMPDFDGLEDFEGVYFHSSRWDHSISLDDKRIGVIGTGSTAVQITGALAGKVRNFKLFQRTAQWISPQENLRYTPDELAAFRDDPALVAAARQTAIDEFVSPFAHAVIDADSPYMKRIEGACRRNLEENVTDPELRERLRPDYRAACKRLVISPDFYQAIQRDNTELVTAGIDRFTARGIRTKDGVEHELDLVVIATGFQVDRFMRPMDIIGRDGVHLNDVWASGPNAYMSISVPHMPNMFMLNGPNGPVGNFSLIDVAERQLDYILNLIEQAAADGKSEISATTDATSQFETDRIEASKNTIWASGCNSWYLDVNGVPAAWPWGLERFRQEMAAPKLQDYDLREAV